MLLPSEVGGGVQGRSVGEAGGTRRTTLQLLILLLRRRATYHFIGQYRLPLDHLLPDLGVGVLGQTVQHVVHGCVTRLVAQVDQIGGVLFRFAY